MTHPLRHFLLGFLLLSVFCPDSLAQNRALLIGISQYKEMDSLRYADADVKKLSQILTDFAGYGKSDVTVLLNQDATKNRIEDEIDKVVVETEKQPIDHFILMFAGHGLPGRLEAKESNAFLAPTDAKMRDNHFFSAGNIIDNRSFINRAWLAKQLTAINAKSIVIILDSCYSGTKAFGDLFVENMGYSIRSFGVSGAARGVALVQRNPALSGQTVAVAGKRVAYLASSREDQPSAEYDELRHGALSYSIFESIGSAQRGSFDDDRKELSVENIYSDITRLFREVKVQGRALGDIHQPILMPIPDFAGIKDMAFVTVRGVKKKELGKGILELRTDPVGAQVFVDGVKRTEVTNSVLELPEGRHHIELYLPSTGYRDSFTVDIHPARPVTQAVTMRGVLQVESFWEKDGQRSGGPNLDVYLNGTHVGKSRLRLNTLVAGTHMLEVRYENVSKSRHVEIRPDSPLQVNYVVIRQAAPRVDRDRRGVDNVGY